MGLDIFTIAFQPGETGPGNRERLMQILHGTGRFELDENGVGLVELPDGRGLQIHGLGVVPHTDAPLSLTVALSAPVTEEIVDLLCDMAEAGELVMLMPTATPAPEPAPQSIATAVPLADPIFAASVALDNPSHVRAVLNHAHETFAAYGHRFFSQTLASATAVPGTNAPAQPDGLTKLWHLLGGS